MPNFSCKKLTFIDHFDYSSIVAHHHNKDSAGFKNEIRAFYAKTMRNNNNRDKTINALSYLWCDFTGTLGVAKRDVIDACFFYGDKWTDLQALERYNCLMALTFDNYRDVLRAVTDCGYEFFTTEGVKEKLMSRGGTKLSDATITDQINQILGTMKEIGVVKRYKRGLYKLSKWPVVDAVSIWIVLKTYEALSALGNSSWFLKCFNFEINKDFVSFFPDFDYSALVGRATNEAFTDADAGFLRLSMGEWSYSDGEMVYDIGKRKSEIMRNLYVTIEDMKNALGKEIFDGWANQEAGCR